MTTKETSHTLAQWPQVLMNTYRTPDVEMVRGHGATLIDAAGTSYIDFLSGIAVNSLGYGHEGLAQAVYEQTLQLTHVSNLLGSAPVVRAAAGLIERFPRPDARVFFCNSGAEANEAAFKLARKTGRSRILAAVHGFHGRTMGALAMTGQPDKRAPFEPMPAGVEFFDYGDAAGLTELVMQAPQDVAAIIIEPIQGETGVVPAPEGFMSHIRQLCDQVGALMVLDEVQTGVGRTGEFFAFSHEAGVVPDVVTLAKGLGGGLPIGACLAAGPAAQLFGPGDHGTTFGGNPVACAAAGVVLDTVDDGFLATVRARGDQLRRGVEKLPVVESVRGRGLMLGVVLAKPCAKAAVAAGMDRAVILNAPQDNVLRLVPPLVITEEEVDQGLECLAQALQDVTA
ncbi:acetylornithine transaminase [Corynebacterium uberis]|uniref:acetylornithine transaminase n=1 Tax=Corynebacterium TaxID=1716 RepID=UPI001D0AD7DF|nr:MULTISPECIES: acetylornithine transaminase [Corynebacterium]MCZ9309171.1 acetylornithine transaminase [Corynebacterium sp. c6VSa_13]UDL74370.1 acetylornithine transaminase [Corynebacterium uberis]UDL76796.1 acetylornithine transaminase [Corynebacterium uberis]UDL79009.1 acetylornithine transaminase [Corynebacterium uberis]UDL81286.1 acetylornithine transaminase [Corynebacterium uberis]